MRRCAVRAGNSAPEPGDGENEKEPATARPSRATATRGGAQQPSNLDEQARRRWRWAAIMEAFNSRYKQHQHEVWAEFYLQVDVVVK